MHIHAQKFYKIMDDKGKLLIKMIGIVPEKKILPLRPGGLPKWPPLCLEPKDKGITVTKTSTDPTAASN